MAGHPANAVAERIKKARNTWKQVSREIFRNKAFVRKIKILLWNTLIRSTMIYGVRAKALPRHLLGGNRNIYEQSHKSNGR